MAAGRITTGNRSMPVRDARRDPGLVPTAGGAGGWAIPLLAACLSSVTAPGVLARPPDTPAVISQVAHDPGQPRPDAPVLVTARYPAGGAQVTLRVQAVAPGKYVRKSDPAYEKDWAEL